MVNYGGDEVSALVVDIGSSSLRAGYAGDDTPRAVIPTSYGYHVESTDTDVTMDDGAEHAEPLQQVRAKVYVGQSGPSHWRSNMEVANPIVDGLIQDFGVIPGLVHHALDEVLRCNPAEHPILCTEPAWNTPANRERMAEIVFEELDAPAFYIANSGVLNAFAAGKGSALVIDIGQSMASVTPVVDGFVLRKGLATSNLPQFIQGVARNMLTSPNQYRKGINLIPHQLISSKQPVEPNRDPRFEPRDDRDVGTTDSWRRWAEMQEVDEWMQSVAAVLEHGWNDQAVALKPSRQYEFATGYNTFFGAERFGIGENYFVFAPQMAQQNPNLPKTLPALIQDSLRTCDIELRQVLTANVVLTGGGSLLSGLSDRLHNELSRNFPHVKIHAPGNPIERRFGAWLGGSILGSLGTFHQLWISKEEWQEHGKAIVGQRCK